MIDIEPRGLDLPKRKLPKELKKLTEKYKNPEIKISFWDRMNKWFIDSSSLILSQVVQMIIPKWFWLALLAIILVATILVVVL